MEVKAGSTVGEGRGMLFFWERRKRSSGEREPSRCMWCSVFGREVRKGWRGELHILGGGYRMLFCVYGFPLRAVLVG